MGINLAPTTVAFFLVSLLELLFIVIPLVVLHFYHKPPAEEFKKRLVPAPRTRIERIADIALGLGIGVGFLFLGDFVWIWTRNAVIRIWGPEIYQQASEGSVNTAPPSMQTWELVLSVVIMFVLVALAEEFCFRGVLFREMGKKRLWIGVIGSSFLFAIYHVFPGVVPIVTFLTFWPYYFTFGLVLAGLVHWRKGDLVSAIIAHGTFNSILFILAYT